MEIENLFAKLLEAYHSSDTRAMLENARDYWRQGEGRAAYWILHAFILGHMAGTLQYEMLKNALVPLENALYKSVKK
jgi:hypothetical protein